MPCPQVSPGLFLILIFSYSENTFLAIVQRKGNRNRPLYSPCANEDDPSRKLVGRMDTKLTVTIVDPTTTMARILSSKLVHKISVRQQRDENISSSPIVFSFFTNALIVFLMKPGRCFIILLIIRRPYSAILFCVYGSGSTAVYFVGWGDGFQLKRLANIYIISNPRATNLALNLTIFPSWLPFATYTNFVPRSLVVGFESTILNVL